MRSIESWRTQEDEEKFRIDELGKNRRSKPGTRPETPTEEAGSEPPRGAPEEDFAELLLTIGVFVAFAIVVALLARSANQKNAAVVG